MNRILLVGAIFLCLAACASSAPEAVPTVAAAQTAASNHAIPTENEPVANDASELHVVDVPEVAQVAHQAPQEGGKDPNELICKRIKVTGSHRVTRICRTRAQIEEARAEHQAMMKEMGRTPDGIQGSSYERRTTPVGVGTPEG